MKKKIISVYFLLLGITFCFAEKNHGKDDEKSSHYESSFTSIAQKDCHTLESDNLGSIQECESFAGMKVTVIEGDIRQSITLTRDNKKYELSFWNTISYGFSSLGLDLEWRYIRNQFDNPLGMIVRLEVNEDDENLDDVTSYLVVSKITEKEICVVGKVSPQKNQEKVARGMVENSKDMQCLSSLKLNLK